MKGMVISCWVMGGGLKRAYMRKELTHFCWLLVEMIEA